MAVLGPALIVGSVLVVLHDLAFGGLITRQHLDVLPQWIPNFCFLGQNLRGGDIPAWNPHVMGGIPFAADPQSGWMHLPAMVLFTALPCGVAIRWLIVLQPIVGGLGLYWFLRGEGLSRTSATVGGVVLSLGAASSALAVNLPFMGSLAWTAVLLGAASRYLRAESWRIRTLWLLAAAVAWGQIAAAHLSNGLVLGTAALFAFGVARTVMDLRQERRSIGELAALWGVLIVALPLVNLAFLLPRLAYIPRTTLGMGYRELAALTMDVGGESPLAFGPQRSLDPAWPMLMAVGPGASFGAGALLLSLAGWWHRQTRALSVAFGIYGAVSYAIALQPTARTLRPMLRFVPFGDFYLHAPERFGIALALAVPVLGALGVEAWRRAGGDPWRRLAMLLPGVTVWALTPFLLGADRTQTAILLPAAAVAILVLVAAAARPSLVLLLPPLLAGELIVGALWGQAAGKETGTQGLEVRRPLPLVNLREPVIDVEAFLRPGRIARSIRDAGTVRFVSLGPRSEFRFQNPEHWAGMHNQRSLLLGLESAEGYNPLQLKRVWMLFRAAQPGSNLRYNRATIESAEGPLPDLLQVGLVVASRREPLTGGVDPLVREGEWVLYRRRQVPDRAAVFTSWRVVTPDEAFSHVAERGPPRDEVLLERRPPLRHPRKASRDEGRATFRWLGPTRATVEVEAPAPAVVMVRNVHDEHWDATVDGRPAPVLRADYVLTGVPVPPGRHTIVLEYDDPWIGYGLIGSAAAILALVGSGWVPWRRLRGGREPARSPEA